MLQANSSIKQPTRKMLLYGAFFICAGKKNILYSKSKILQHSSKDEGLYPKNLPASKFSLHFYISKETIACFLNIKSSPVAEEKPIQTF
jgi:hypothetical protein